MDSTRQLRVINSLFSGKIAKSSLVRNAIFIVFVIAIFTGHSPASPCRYSLAGDLNNDCKVDLVDVSIMAANWLVDCNQSPLNPACVDNMLEAQKAQYHALEFGIEIYGNDFGSYPASADNQTRTFPPELGDDPNAYCGATKLAEAMVGIDLLGFHPDSNFRSDGLRYIYGYGVESVYTNTPENIAERYELLIDPEFANAYRLEDIYEDVGPFNGSTIVLCDVFEKERHSGKHTGMPILFFRARTNYAEQDCADGNEDDIYYYPDNLPILQLGSAENQLIQHPLGDGVNDCLDFENMILNPNITVVKRPYRAESFILMSAGYDGLYGTPDDVFNFGY